MRFWLGGGGSCSAAVTGSVPQGQISRGAHYTLQKNGGDLWEVADSAGDTISAPGVCFMIPPPDPEAIALAEQ